MLLLILSYFPIYDLTLNNKNNKLKKEKEEKEEKEIPHWSGTGILYQWFGVRFFRGYD